MSVLGPTCQGQNTSSQTCTRRLLASKHHFIIEASKPYFAVLLGSGFLYRKVIVIVLIAAFFAQTFSRIIFLADYYTNTQTYAKTCENKNKPQLHCNGKCQLMKKMRQEEKKDQDNPQRKAENNSDIVMSAKSSFASLALLFASRKSSNKFHSSPGSKPTDRSLAIFHPPQFAA